jgi:hypothetical protein
MQEFSRKLSLRLPLVVGEKCRIGKDANQQDSQNQEPKQDEKGNRERRYIEAVNNLRMHRTALSHKVALSQVTISF